MKETTVMTDDLVNAAREALVGVTEGPWHVTECGDYWVESADTADGCLCFCGIALCGDTAWPHADTRQPEWENNAKFIAAARSLVPAMADRIEALEMALAAAEARAASWAEWADAEAWTQKALKLMEGQQQ
jgi:hypothetical protein